MDIVRLFFSEVDIKPTVLLKHFLHFLGFYVMKNDENESFIETESVADIYIISNVSVKSEWISRDIVDEKSIFILMDKWTSNNPKIEKIYYKESNSSANFLVDLIECLSRIISRNKGSRLLCSEEDWKNEAIMVAKAYVDSGLLQASLFTRCFYKQNEFYDWGMEKYSKFIEQIPKEKSDFLNYVSIFARYEANLISKKNKYVYDYNTKQLLQECNYLLKKYGENEELHFLKADILFELEDNWAEASERYGDTEVYCYSYAYLKKGKIFRLYDKDYSRALDLLKKAVTVNKAYYQAWYQLGECYDAIGDYSEAIKSFKKIYTILECKYKKHILAPLEWEYMYKAIRRIALINKLRIANYESAGMYNDIANSICEKKAITEYIIQMLEDKDSIINMRDKIYDAIEEHVKVKLEEIY